VLIFSRSTAWLAAVIEGELHRGRRGEGRIIRRGGRSRRMHNPGKLRGWLLVDLHCWRSGVVGSRHADQTRVKPSARPKASKKKVKSHSFHSGRGVEARIVRQSASCQECWCIVLVRACVRQIHKRLSLEQFNRDWLRGSILCENENSRNSKRNRSTRSTTLARDQRNFQALFHSSGGLLDLKNVIFYSPEFCRRYSILHSQA
jgi:hypothetical protein